MLPENHALYMTMQNISKNVDEARATVCNKVCNQTTSKAILRGHNRMRSVYAVDVYST